jgi:hypothetical protein
MPHENLTPRRCSELRGLVQESRSLTNWLEGYRRDLGILIQDHELLTAEAGTAAWQLHLAVDFREVYMFAFPFSDLLRVYDAAHQDPTYLRDLALEYLARACLFRRTQNLGPLTLLPPYRHELNSNLLSLFPSRVTEARIDDLAAKLTVLLEKPIRNLLAAPPSESTDVGGSPAELAGLVSLLSEHYTDLILLLLAESSDLLARFREILGTKVVPPSPNSLFWRAAPSQGRIEWWQDKFPDSRRRDRKRNTLRDAQALAIVEEANRLAGSAQKNDLFLLVTSTKAILEVAESAGDAAQVALPGGRSTPLVRSGHLFLVYLHCLDELWSGAGAEAREARSMNSAVLRNLRVARSRADELLKLSQTAAVTLPRCPCERSAQEDDVPGDDCPLRAMEPQTEVSLAELKRTKEELENAQLILKNHPDLESRYLQILKSADLSDFDELLRGVLERVLHSREMRSVVYSRIRNLANRLLIELLGLNAQLACYVGEVDAERMAYILEFPFYVRLETEPLKSELRHAAEETENAALTGDLQRVTSALRGLLTSMLQSSASLSDKCLVELMVLLAVGDARLARRLADLCIRSGDVVISPGYEYLRIRATMASDSRAASALCTKAIGRYPEDGRFLLLGGLFKWRDYVASGKTDPRLLEEALAMTSHGVMVAQDDKEWRLLLCDLLNNKAYYLAETGPAGAAEAFGVLSSLQAIWPLEAWRSSWLDTYAFVRLCRASDDGIPVADRRRLVVEAIPALQRALSGIMSRASRELAQQHLDTAVGLLTHLTPSGETCPPAEQPTPKEK